ncbi:MAG: uroporphyrinogen decarboxylase family protein [Phycisphaerae bacterium]|nr:uroporphyrinogen decarboxylase family protein [Phycisphaerae bacterium]
MTRRDVFKAVITFDDPPRIGMSMPEPYGDDMLVCEWGGQIEEPVEPQGSELKRWRDAWGCAWASLTDHDKGEVVLGAIEDWSDLDAYVPPDMGREEEYRAADEQFAADDEHFRVGMLPGFTFNISRKLRRLGNYLCDLMCERENIDRLHDIVRSQLLTSIDRWAAAGADAIGFNEDWGMQDRLMISPDMWREIFKPEFQTLTARARDRGLKVWMHSCGLITDIIPDLIECGIDVLQFDQPRLHGIDKLAEFAGKITFQCPVDIQTTLQSGDPELIRAEARELVEKLGSAGGGFVAGYYWGNEAIGITPEIQDQACQAFAEYGSYR